MRFTNLCGPYQLLHGQQRVQCATHRVAAGHLKPLGGAVILDKPFATLD